MAPGEKLPGSSSLREMGRRVVPAPSPTSAANGLTRAATLPAGDLLKELGATAGGLSAEEAEVRLHRFGENRVSQPGGPPLLRRFVEQLTHFFALMLWVAAALAFVGRMPQLGWAIIAVVLVNGVFSFAQEYRADRATRALSALLPETGTVLRDGRKALSSRVLPTRLFDPRPRLGAIRRGRSTVFQAYRS